MQISSFKTSQVSSTQANSRLVKNSNRRNVANESANRPRSTESRQQPKVSKKRAEELINSVMQQVLSTIDQRTIVDPSAQTVTSVDSAPFAIEGIQSGGIEESLMASLQPDAAGMVNEEEMQFGIVKFLLENQSPEAAEAFSAAVSRAIEQGVELEDSIKFGLSEVVEQGLIDSNSAEMINGVSFRAAQLDSDHTALFDSRGGPGDNTVATMNLESAIETAKAALEQIQSGEVQVDSRALDAASNIAPGASLADHTQGGNFTNGSSLSGFLWKPSSEADGRLVVLLPQALTGNVVSAGIYSDLPATQSNRIEEGRFSGDSHNGGRAHFRFSQSGGSYPDGSFIVATLRNGENVTFQIGDSASRNE